MAQLHQIDEVQSAEVKLVRVRKVAAVQAAVARSEYGGPVAYVFLHGESKVSDALFLALARVLVFVVDVLPYDGVIGFELVYQGLELLA